VQSTLRMKGARGARQRPLVGVAAATCGTRGCVSEATHSLWCSARSCDGSRAGTVYRRLRMLADRLVCMSVVALLLVRLAVEATLAIERIRRTLDGRAVALAHSNILSPFTPTSLPCSRPTLAGNLWASSAASGALSANKTRGERRRGCHNHGLADA